MTENTFDKALISDEEWEKVKISRVNTRPNAKSSYGTGSYTASDTKALFDKQGELLKKNHNELVESLKDIGEAESKREEEFNRAQTLRQVAFEQAQSERNSEWSEELANRQKVFDDFFDSLEIITEPGETDPKVMSEETTKKYMQNYIPKVATKNLADLTFKNASIDDSEGHYTEKTTGKNYAASEAYIAVIGGEAYTFSWAQHHVYSIMYVHEYKADKTYIRNTFTETHKKNFITVTTDAECAFIRIHFYSYKDTPWSDLVPDKLQMELGTEATEYIAPIIIDNKIIGLNSHPDMADVVRQRDMANVVKRQEMEDYIPKVATRNLANLTFKDATLNDTSGNFKAPSNGINNAAAEEYIAVTGGENYTFSWERHTIYSGIYIYQYDEDKSFIKYGLIGKANDEYSNSVTLTVESNCAYIRVRFYSYATSQIWSDLIPNKFQIEEGHVATPYVKPIVINTDELDVELINDKGIDYAAYGLPVLEFKGNITGMNKDNAVTLAYTYGEKSGSCTLKWQGSSSLRYPKKNYTVKFDTAFEAKEGWGEQKKYCLKANYIDFSHSRNICCAKLWGGVVKSRTPENATLNALVNGGAIDGFPICVVINGVYVGLYTFNIPKDGWMFGMGDGTQEAILCADASAIGACSFDTLATLDGDFDVEYAPDEDNTEWIKTSLNRLIQACMDSDGTDLDTTIAQYLDWESAIDYYVHCLITHNFDGITKNYLLATYDGVKWFFSAYDMDSTFGLYWDGSSFVKAIELSIADTASKHRIFNLIKTYKTDELEARYNELVVNTSGALSEETITQTFLNFAGTIPKALLDEEVKIWAALPGTSVNNVSQILDFNRRRRAYIDPQIEAL